MDFFTMLTTFHFLQPSWLLLIPVTVAVAYFSAKKRVNRTYWQAICDPELIPFLEQKGEGRSSRLFISLLIAALLLIVAAAQPVWEKQPQPVFKQGNALVIALDLSASMNAEDIKPSRLQRARFKIEDLLARIPDAQVALLVYAAEAFSVTPLTDDSDTILAQLPAMVPEIMPVQGSRADKALILADQLLTQAGIERGNILLVSDEVLPVDIAAIATRLKSQGRQISILGVGTEQGAPINTEQGILKDQNGQVIVAKVQASLMQESAGLGGGQAKMITVDDSDINYLVAQFQRDEQRPAESNEKMDRWVAEGPWFILCALPFVLMVFRRGIVALLIPLLLPIVLLGGGGYSNSAEAEPVKATDHKGEDSVASSRQVWADLWQTKDQQALALYRSGDKAGAAEVFENPKWKQFSYYESGQYDKAETVTVTPQTPAEWYNLGNILARKGELERALNAYDQALEAQPDFEDARYNRNVVEELFKQQSKQKQNNATPNGQQKENSHKNNGDGSDNEDANGQNSEEGMASDSNTEGAGAQNGSSQKANQQTGGSDNQSQVPKQHTKNTVSDDQVSSEGSQGSSEQDKSAADEQLQQALKDKIDQQLKDESDSTAALNDIEDNTADDKKVRPSGIAPTGRAEQISQPLDEAEQARQQLLNRIEDDPAGLWRRKFIYQYRQQSSGQAVEEKQW